ALSYDALKIQGTDSARQIVAIRRAIRQTNFSDSITHGPRMKTGFFPPMVTLPTLSGFGFMRRYTLRAGTERVHGICHHRLELASEPSRQTQIIDRKRKIKHAEENKR